MSDTAHTVAMLTEPTPFQPDPSMIIEGVELKGSPAWARLLIQDHPDTVLTVPTFEVRGRWPEVDAAISAHLRAYHSD